MTKLDGLANEIKTMHNLEDVTNMLEQVAARDIAQMREQILQGRPFFQEFWKIYRVLKQLAPPPPEVVHKQLVVAIAIDWGMPGNLLNQVLDKAEHLYEEHEADMLIAGKMGHARFKNRDERTIHLFSAPKKSSLTDIEPIYKIVAGYAHTIFVYPQFESLSRQSIAVDSMSIGEQPPQEIDAGTQKEVEAKRFIIEPGPQEIANYMNETVVGLSMYHYFAESLLAYSAAQMVAMRNAYDNAKNESKSITYRYHKARREIIDAKLRELYGSRTQAGL
jgi:ATP synthase F1 gamma subunit